jgi:CRP-like cAMP-binding protein
MTMPESSSRSKRGRYSRGSFLTRLTGDQLAELLTLGRPVSYAADQTIVPQGRRKPPLLLLQAGFVKAERRALKRSHPAVVDVYGPGDVLGAEAAYVNKRAHVAFVATRAVMAHLVPQSTFLAYLDRNPALMRQLMTTFAHRVRQGEAALAYSRHDVRERLIAFLTRQQVFHGMKTAEGDLIDMGLNRGDIGAAIGASEASVDDALRRLRADGYILTGYKRIWIKRRLSEELSPVLQNVPPPQALG